MLSCDHIARNAQIVRTSSLSRPPTHILPVTSPTKPAGPVARTARLTFAHPMQQLRTDHTPQRTHTPTTTQLLNNMLATCVQMRNSMLAMGACERVKKIARVYPVEVANSAIMQELLGVIKDDPASALSGAVMQVGRIGRTGHLCRGCVCGGVCG